MLLLKIMPIIYHYTSFINLSVFCCFKVKVNFLVVGHTHEDIDQLFSKVAEEINAHGCKSLPGNVLHTYA